MKKIENFNLGNENGTSFEELKKGIYICKIVNVQDIADKEYLHIEFDIVKDQAGNYANYFSKQPQTFGWANAGTERRSYKESAKQFFEGFITAIVKSNPGYEWDWNEHSLVGKMFIGVFGEEEYLNKDKTEIKTNVRLQAIRSFEALKEGKVKVPENVKKLTAKQLEEYRPVAQVREVFGNATNVTVAAPTAAQPVDDIDLPF